MAGKYPPSKIAIELDRGLTAVVMKAHELNISLRVDRARRGAVADSGAGIDDRQLGWPFFMDGPKIRRWKNPN